MNFEKTLSLSDYERLKSVSIESWSDEELSQFLVWDFLNVLGSTIVAKDVPESFVKNNELLAKKYKKYLFVTNLIDGLFQKLILFFSFKKYEKKFYSKA